MLKRNLVANYLGQGWSALMGLAFIPLYIKFVGIEAYGLIGLFALIVSMLTLFEMGLTPVLNREVAGFTAGAHTHHSIWDLVRSLEVVAIVVAAVIACGVSASASWVAGSWLVVEDLPVEVVAESFTIMGLVAALRAPESIYRSIIIGLQRQVLFNVANSALSTVRGIGAVAVLAWVSPTIQAFFLWQGLLSIITLIVLGGLAYKSLPQIERAPRFSGKALRQVWRFAGGLVGIAFLSLLLSQVDKILLSKLLSLSEYGYYTLAAVVAGGLFVLIGPITQAFYPRLCELNSRNDAGALAAAYHSGAQLVSVFAGSAAIIIMLFSETLLRFWTQDYELAARSAPILSLLMLGNMLNGIMWIPYQMQLAHGWTSLSIYINSVSVVIILPALLWVTPRFGAEGAAWVWVSLNMARAILGMHFMFRKILTTEKVKWYLEDILFPLGAALLVGIVLKGVSLKIDAALLQYLLLGVAQLLALGAAVLGAGRVRKQVIKVLCLGRDEAENESQAANR